MMRTFFIVLLGLALVVSPVAAQQGSVAAARDLYSSAAYQRRAHTSQSPTQRRPRGGRDAVRRAVSRLVPSGAWSERGGEGRNRGRRSGRSALSAVGHRRVPSHPRGLCRRAQACVARNRPAALRAGESRVRQERLRSRGRWLFAGAQDLWRCGSRRVADQPPLADLQMLAVGFQELSAKAIPPPVPVRAEVPLLPPVAVSPVRVATMPPRVFSASDTKVVPPVTIRQDLPPYTFRLAAPVTGTIEVVIEETGAIESAMVHASISREYRQPSARGCA